MSNETKAAYIGVWGGIIGIVIGALLPRLLPDENVPEVRAAAIHIGASTSDAVLKLSMYNAGSKPAAVSGVELAVEQRWVIQGLVRYTSFVQVSGNYDVTLPTEKEAPFSVYPSGVMHGLKPGEFDALNLRANFDPVPKNDVVVYLAHLTLTCDGHDSVDAGWVLFGSEKGNLCELSGSEPSAETEAEADKLFLEIKELPSDRVHAALQLQVANRVAARSIRNVILRRKALIVQESLKNVLFEVLTAAPDKSVTLVDSVAE